MTSSTQIAGCNRIEGGCVCGKVRYRLNTAPLFVHCCHCRWCQRESGSAFAVNALIEAHQVEVLSGTPDAIAVPTQSGAGQVFYRCTDCYVALWSQYSGLGDQVLFIRAGTLDEPDQMPPDIHIFTRSKQPWVILPEDVRVCEKYYKWQEEWPQEAQARREVLGL